MTSTAHLEVLRARNEKLLARIALLEKRIEEYEDELNLMRARYVYLRAALEAAPEPDEPDVVVAPAYRDWYTTTRAEALRHE